MATPSLAGAIVVAETTVLAAAALTSPKEERSQVRKGEGGEGGTPVANSPGPSLDIKGVRARTLPYSIWVSKTSTPHLISQKCHPFSSAIRSSDRQK